MREGENIVVGPFGVLVSQEARRGHEVLGKSYQRAIRL